jgi:putative phosphoesterase
VEKTIKIGLISDVHATPAPLEEALSIFRRMGVETILCAGDIAGYGEVLDETVELLIANGCQSIFGNHDLWFLEEAQDESASRAHTWLGGLPAVLEKLIQGKKLYMVHASPPYDCMEGIKLLDEYGNLLPGQKQEWTERLAGFDYDVLVVGHTHQVFAERLGGTLVVNPGSTKFNHSCAVLSFPSLEFEVFPLSNQPVVKTWNWGANQIKTTEG